MLSIVEKKLESKVKVEFMLECIPVIKFCTKVFSRENVMFELRSERGKEMNHVAISVVPSFWPDRTINVEFLGHSLPTLPRSLSALWLEYNEQTRYKRKF
jgi:hypothetical protein